MQEQTCPTCYGEGIENHLSRSRAQTFRDSPRFYSVYCKVCGHIDGVFAQDVFQAPPRSAASQRGCPTPAARRVASSTPRPAQHISERAVNHDSRHAANP